MSTEPNVPENRFFEGILAPVMDERNDAELEVVGELPAGLQGMFVRNGPNPQFAPEGAYHPFDGDGMIHALYVEDGKARYRNRWIESAGLLAERKRGHACFGSVSQFKLPAQDVMDEVGMMKNNGNTHTVRHAGKYLALMEAAPPTELSRELGTVGEYDFAGKLKGPMTAHPKIDSKTGEMFFFGYSPFPPYLRYHVADASGALVHSVEIDLPAPVMIHDFALTENYVVFFDAPGIFDLDSMMKGEPGVRWEPERGTRIGILPRRGGNDDIRWVEIDNCFPVHFWNAWDDGDKVEIYGPSFEKMPGGLQFDNPSQIEEPKPWHWSVDLTEKTASGEQTDDRSGEFPRINDDRAGRRHRYQYNALARTWEFEFDFHGVIKYDMESGTSEEYVHGENAVSGEHVFAADPAGQNEDDGWLLSVVTDRLTKRSEFRVLDARDVAAGPIARVKVPRRVPLGFHANWFPDA
ncbi:MAG: carotenoid oxygenase family protein [Candidatus Binatia bacterium]|nr:carotenoid oxygenase family protein [Candidatus Binatia bacterium]